VKLYKLEREQIIPAGLGDVWSFFADPHNLALLTPPSLNLRVPADTPRCVHPGMMITYRVRPFGWFYSTWVTEITQVAEEKLFVDEQRFGPYRFWHHEHHFRDGDRGTVVRDLVHYAMPFGPLGRLAHKLVRARLDEIFAYREKAIQSEFHDSNRLPAFMEENCPARV
jgi:ligand-binding SRPBCC domain-containing protein